MKINLIMYFILGIMLPILGVYISDIFQFQGYIGFVLGILAFFILIIGIAVYQGIALNKESKKLHDKKNE